jgi:antitoxin MazE
MNLQVAKWGNSLAMRLPAELVRHLGAREGDKVQAQLAADGSLTIRLEGWDRRAFAGELAQAREAMPMGQPVIEEVRAQARY